jgi:putative endonuclease
MKCFVYFLYSDKSQKYYVGISNDITDRLKRHNNGQSLSTKAGAPWVLVCFIASVDKSIAMQLEKKIKSRGIKRYLLDNDLPIMPKL